MKEQYVIKTRNDEDEYLAYEYCRDKNTADMFFLTSELKEAQIFPNLDSAESKMYLPVLKENKYKVDIYKLKQCLEFVERGI